MKESGSPDAGAAAAVGITGPAATREPRLTKEKRADTRVQKDLAPLRVVCAKSTQRVSVASHGAANNKVACDTQFWTQAVVTSGTQPSLPLPQRPTVPGRQQPSNALGSSRLNL